MIGGIVTLELVAKDNWTKFEMPWNSPPFIQVQLSSLRDGLAVIT